MKSKMYRLYWLICCFIPLFLCGQEKQSPWDIKGYTKFLHTYLIYDALSTELSDQLLHNRLNVKYYVNDAWTFRAELRSRLFYGELVRSFGDYRQLVDNANNDYFDLDWIIGSGSSWVAHTMLDRLAVEYSKGDWEIKLGRQRINWGINTFWNAHDIFNTFSFTDFDYEERPGSDALSVRYFTGPTSSITFAAKAANHIRRTTFGGLLKLNQGSYDIQILGGYYQDNGVAGVGWAGNLGNFGFKGEWSYFHALSDQAGDHVFTGASGIDYSFVNGLYFQFGGMYNSGGEKSTSITQLFTFELSAKNQYPYTGAIYLQGAYPITPLLSTSLSFIYSPVKVHPLFINPGISFSIASNWDLDILSQMLFEKQQHFKSSVKAIFLRLKFSY